MAGGFFADRTATPCAIPFVPERGAKSLITGGDQQDISVGYARVQPTGGSAAPAALAAFANRPNAVLVTEATVPASALVLSGRIPAFISPSLNTGLAIANPFSQQAILNYYLTDANGNRVKEGSTPVPAYSQIHNC